MDFDKKKIWTKRTIFFAKYCNKPAKKTTTLLTTNIIQQDRKIVKVKYVFLSLGNKRKIYRKKMKKNYFFLVVRPLPPSPYSGRTTKKKKKCGFP